MIRRNVAVATLALILAAAAVQWLPTAAAAQEQWLEMLRSDLKTEKKAILTAAMDFTPEQSEVFWPIYREYDLELSKAGDTMLTLIKDYAANYEQMTDVKAKELTERVFKLEKERIDIRQKYTKKFEKAMDPIVAARFAQVERQIGLLVDVQIAAEMPLVEKPAP